ncbi:unnamed protein product [Heterobilharzia americana]|nr:unnamed protein product [Heterobilharzia americana]
MTSDLNIMSQIVDLIHKGDNEEIQKLIKLYDKDPGGYLQTMNECDEMQKSAIELFTILDYRNIVEKAISNGYNELHVNRRNGYNLAHYAAMWNRADLLKYLYFAGVDMYSKNIYGETAHKLAEKYEQKEAMHILEWIECRDQFLTLIRLVREILATADKNVYTREERIALSLVSMKYWSLSSIKIQKD